jgi:hypothetical protein
VDVREPAEGAGIRGCAAVLTQLLAGGEEYRARWLRSMRRRSSGSVHQGAVAQVIAEYLWESGQAPEGDVDLPRRLKDTVSRALSGQVIAPTTLSWFVEAFAMSEQDSARLWAAWSGQDGEAIGSGRGAGAGDLAPPSTYRTVALHEFHTLGADGLPQSHRTVHVIRALQQVRCYPYRFDTDAVRVEVLRGGRAGPLYRTSMNGVFAVDIELTRPLAPGETGSFEYRTVFDYRQPPAPQFRRATRRRCDNVEINVRFHPDRLPAHVCWAVWAGYGADEPLEQEPVTLDPDASVHRYLETLEGRAVGFRWEF